MQFLMIFNEFESKRFFEARLNAWNGLSFSFLNFLGDDNENGNAVLHLDVRMKVRHFIDVLHFLAFQERPEVNFIANVRQLDRFTSVSY